MGERDEQIRKLGDLLHRCIDGVVSSDRAAEAIYDMVHGKPTGTSPEPPEAPEVVVSNAAENAFIDWYRGPEGKGFGWGGGLAAAFPHLLAANTAHPLVVEVVNRAIRERVAKIKLAPFSGVFADVAGQAVPRGALLTALGVTPAATTP